MKSQIKKIFLSMIMVLCISAITPSVFPQMTNTVEAASVKLSKSKATLSVGKSITLKIKGTKKKAKWTSSKKSVATVNKKGKVVAKKAGTAVITAKIGKKKYKCKIKVVKNKKGLSGSTKKNNIVNQDTTDNYKSILSISNTSLTIQDSGTVDVTFEASTGTVRYDIADSTIVSCRWGSWNDNYNIPLQITALRNGTTTITISNTYNSETKVITVTVNKPIVYGTVTENITYHYNQYQGYKPDTNARVILIPTDGSAKGDFPYNGSWFRYALQNDPVLSRYNMYAGVVDGMGNYTINRIPTGTYIALIISRNQTEGAWHSADDKEAYYQSIGNRFINYVAPETAKKLGEAVGYNQYDIDYVTVYENTTMTLSYAFGYTYL